MSKTLLRALPLALLGILPSGTWLPSLEAG